jgi:phosphoribosylformimino-5-aminoimidazole carboxamide ribotide isomerase
MQIIPVIDLLNGAVVHAKQGARQHYQPIKSLLTSSSKPLDIVAALLDIYPFTRLYIADLNAIQYSGDNFSAIRAIAQKFPQLALWIDAGLMTLPEELQNKHRILGSENFAHLEDYLAFNTDFILSLDFMPEPLLDKPILDKNHAAGSQYPCAFQGSAELLKNSAYWPNNVIVMSLAQVGANAGVNVDLMQKILALRTNQNIYAAGGVRDLEDLIQLKNIGIHGALVATALHQKQLGYNEIKSLDDIKNLLQ